jgi:hypothetical protein
MDPVTLTLLAAAGVVWNSGRIDKLEREAKDKKAYDDLFRKTDDPYAGMFDDLREKYNY